VILFGNVYFHEDWFAGRLKMQETTVVPFLMALAECSFGLGSGADEKPTQSHLNLADAVAASLSASFMVAI